MSGGGGFCRHGYLSRRWVLLDKRYNSIYTDYLEFIILILFMMKTAISMPEEIFRAAEDFAKRRNITRSELYRTALSEYIANYAPDEVTKRLNRVYEEETSYLQPADARLQSASLPEGDW